MMHNHTDTVLLSVLRSIVLAHGPAPAAVQVCAWRSILINTRGCRLHACCLELLFQPIDRQFYHMCTCSQPPLCIVCSAVSSKWPAETTTVKNRVLQTRDASGDLSAPVIAGKVLVFLQVIDQWQDIITIAEMCGISIFTFTLSYGN